MLKLKQISQAFGDSLSNFRKQNNQTNTKITQKDHNDSHIFYLKTASDPNFDQQIFTLNFQNNQNKQGRLRFRVNSKKQLQKSLILKQNSSGNSSPKDSIIKSTEFKKMSQYPKQRYNTKIDIKDSLQSNMRTNVIHFQNIKTSPLTEQSPPKVNRKSNPNRGKRNYFNVNEFIQNEEMKKYQNSVILMRGNMNSPSLLKKIKQNSPKRKVDDYSRRIKSLQFNAIEVTKSIVEKNTNSNDRMRFKKNNVFLRPNFSLRQSVESRDNILQQQSKLYQHKGQMWRSNSYQIPKKSKFFEQDNETKKNKPKFFNQIKQKTVRTQKYDNLIDLNPWSHQVVDERLTNSKTPYSQIKTQRIESQKRRDDENQFINYYIKTARYQKEQND